jgi:hypothetical protein
MARLKNSTKPGAMDDNAVKRLKERKPYDSNKAMGGSNANYKEKNNPVDAEMDKLQDEEDKSRGITQTLKNVWDAYTD